MSAVSGSTHSVSDDNEPRLRQSEPITELSPNQLSTHIEQLNINDSSKDDNRKIFVGGLGSEITERDLLDYFSQFGPVKSCTTKCDKATGLPRGFGFVTFSTDGAIDKVLSVTDHRVKNKKIDPKVAKPTRDQQKKVFVGGLDPNTQEHVITNHFSKFGKVESVDLPYDTARGRRKEFAFVTFTSEEDAKRATIKDQQEIQGKMCDVRIAIHKDSKPRSGDFSKALNIYANSLNVAAAVYQQQRTSASSVGVVPHQPPCQSSIVPPHYIFNRLASMQNGIPSWLADPATAAMLLQRYQLFAGQEYSRLPASALTAHYAAAMGLNPSIIQQLPSSTQHSVPVPQTRLGSYAQIPTNCDGNQPTVQQHSLPAASGLLLLPNISSQTSLLNNTQPSQATLPNTVPPAPVPISSASPSVTDTNIAYTNAQTGSSNINPYPLQFYLPSVQGSGSVPYHPGASLQSSATAQQPYGFSPSTLPPAYAFAGSGLLDPNTFSPSSTMFPPFLGQKPQSCPAVWNPNNGFVNTSLPSNLVTSSILTPIESPGITTNSNMQQLTAAQLSPLEFYMTSGFQQQMPQQSDSVSQPQANLPYISSCSYPFAGSHHVLQSYPLLSLPSAQTRLSQLVPQTQLQNGPLLSLVGTGSNQSPLFLDVPGATVRSQTGSSSQQHLAAVTNGTHLYHPLQQHQLNPSQPNSSNDVSLLESNVQQSAQPPQHQIPSTSSGGLCFPVLVPVGAAQSKVTSNPMQTQNHVPRSISLIPSGYSNHPSHFSMVVPASQSNPTTQVPSSLLQQPPVNSHHHLNQNHSPGVSRLWSPAGLVQNHAHANATSLGINNRHDTLATNAPNYGAYNYQYHYQPCQHQPALHPYQTHNSQPYQTRHCPPRHHQLSNSPSTVNNNHEKEFITGTGPPRRVYVLNGSGVSTSSNCEHKSSESGDNVGESTELGVCQPESSESGVLHCNGDAVEIGEPDSGLPREVIRRQSDQEDSTILCEQGILGSTDRCALRNTVLPETVAIETINPETVSLTRDKGVNGRRSQPFSAAEGPDLDNFFPKQDSRRRAPLSSGFIKKSESSIMPSQFYAQSKQSFGKLNSRCGHKNFSSAKHTETDKFTSPSSTN